MSMLQWRKGAVCNMRTTKTINAMVDSARDIVLFNVRHGKNTSAGANIKSNLQSLEST